MKKLVINPLGWLCTYAEAPPGFILVHDCLCLKTEYRTDSGIIIGYNSAGEFLSIIDETVVQPVNYRWELYDSQDG